MIPGLISERALQVTKDYITQNPAGSTGYLSSLSRFTAQQKLMIPVSFNGQRNTTEWTDHDALNTGMVLQVKDPKGGRAPHTIFDFRTSDLLISNDGGKVSITGGNSGDFVQLDLLYMGQKSNSGCAVSKLRMTNAHGSTMTSARQIEQNALPLDPFSNHITISPNDGTQSKPYLDARDNIAARGQETETKLTVPKKKENTEDKRTLQEIIVDKALEFIGLPRLSDVVGVISNTYPLNPDLDVVMNSKTGELSIERLKDKMTPQGTNARTGTINYALYALDSRRDAFGYLG